MTTAETRSAEVKAKRIARPDAHAEHIPVVEADQWQPERWEDEGSVRDAAREATRRGRSGQSPIAEANNESPVRERRLGDATRLDPSWVQEVERESDARTSARYMERLAAATEALERDRYGDALRMVQPVLKNLPNVGAAHEVAGIALYRLGEWRKAAAELEQARRLHPAPEQMPVLADCYRALRRYRDVEEIWREIREASPAPSVMAEGRIVAAGALADQGDIAGALKLLIRVADAPKRVRDYHLKQWYVIADLYDRSGDVVKARNFFKRVAAVDPRYADVSDRLAMLGRR
jgi:tetratricopeptide (TPR) repeat protein